MSSTVSYTEIYKNQDKTNELTKLQKNYVAKH